METHSQILARLGGIRIVARELGKPHTTVQGWYERNKVPVEHWPDLVQASERIGKPISAAELMPAELRDVA